MKNEDIIIGIDASTTSTGYAIFKGKSLIKYDKIQPNKDLDWRERIQSIAKTLKPILDEYKPIKCYVEDVPLKKGGMKILVQLGAVQGMILSIMETCNIEVEFIPVATWRRKCKLFDGTEKGKERDNLKKASIEKANKLFNLNLVYKSKSSKFNDDDVSDASLVAYSTFIKDEKTKGFGKKTTLK